MKFFKTGLAVIVSVVPMLSLTVSVSPSRAGLPDLSTAGMNACRDVALGNETNQVKIALENSSDERLASDQKNIHDIKDTVHVTSSSDAKESSDIKDTEETTGKRSGTKSGNLGFAGIKVGGSSQESTENSGKRDNSVKTEEAYKENGSIATDNSKKGENSHKIDDSERTSQKTVFEQSVSTVRQGKNCDSIVESTSKVEINKQDNETNLQIVEKKLDAEKEKHRLDVFKNFLGN